MDVDLAPPQAYLGVLGMPGLTAYAGLLDVAAMQRGRRRLRVGRGRRGGLAGRPDRPAQGRLAGDRQRRRPGQDASGCSTSSASTHALDYKAAPIRQQLREAAPDGIDVYFDNVGGDHLEAAIGSLRLHGRAALCGAMSAYNATEPPPGPRNLARLVQNRLTLRGFLVGDHADARPRFLADMAGWLREGKITWRETVSRGHRVGARRLPLAAVRRQHRQDAGAPGAGRLNALGAPEGVPLGAGTAYAAQMADPYVVVLFGATGDLAKRKLLPGLLHLFQSGLVPQMCVVGTSLEEYDQDSFVEFARTAVDEFSGHPLTPGPVDGVRVLPALRARGGRRRRGCAPRSRRREAELGPGRAAPALPVGAPEGGAGGGEHARGGQARRAQPDHHGEAVRHRPGLGAVR